MKMKPRNRFHVIEEGIIFTNIILSSKGTQVGKKHEKHPNFICTMKEMALTSFKC